MTRTVRIIGAGASVPDRIITNDRLAAAIRGPKAKPWTATQIEERTGIRARRFFFDFDEQTGLAILPGIYGTPPGPSGILAERALREALAHAGLEPTDLDGLYYVTCTPDQLNFGQDALHLHNRLGMRPDALVEPLDTGCGGGLFALQLAQERLESGRHRTIAVIGANVTSPYVNRDIFTSEIEVGGKPISASLTMYLFGDGAGAIILRGEDDHDGPSRFLASTATNQYLNLVHRPGGGALFPPGHPLTTLAQYGYYVDGKLVKACFAPRMRESIERTLAQANTGIADVSRFYLHQANLRLIQEFAAEMGIPMEQVPTHMEDYGNCSAAGVLILFAEEVRKGRIVLGSGELVLLAAIGAGAQSASHLVRL